MSTMKKFYTSALTQLLNIGSDANVGAQERINALGVIAGANPLLSSFIDRDDEPQYEVTEEGQRALAEAVAEACGGPAADDDKAEAAKPTRKRRTKAEIEADKAAEEAAAKGNISESPEDRKEPEADDTTREWHSLARKAYAEVAEDAAGAEDAAEDAGFDWDSGEAEEEPKTVTKEEVIALLNRYAAKHPKKGAGAKAVLSTYGSPALSEISSDKYAVIASELQAYLDAA